MVRADVRAQRGGRILGRRVPSQEVHATPPPPGFDEIERQELSGLFGRMVGIRLAVLPVGAAVALLVAWVEPAPWRAPLLLAVVLGLGAFFVLEALRYRRGGFRPGAMTLNLGVAVAGQLLVAFATGALQSPFLVLAIPIAILIGVFVAPPAHWILLGAQLAGVLGLAAVDLSGWVPDLNLAAFGGAPGAHTAPHAWSTAAVVLVVIGFGSQTGRALRARFDAMLRRALSAQDDSLRAHAERAEELTALSAEIAHELKNPLASVKGLAALLAQGPLDAKAAERLAVLRREVDRMQGALEEFLNFSRPLVPLALGRVDLAALAGEVVALHEGLAHERGVDLSLRSGPASARCDPRKVKQILINLVQNALDASASGLAVEVEVQAPAPSAVCVRVLDQGRGLDPGVGGRVFEPGVTTKDRGSGLGLTIARALARQHGGDLSLSSRPGGGTEAVLLLPGGDQARAGAAGGGP